MHLIAAVEEGGLSFILFTAMVVVVYLAMKITIVK